MKEKPIKEVHFGREVFVNPTVESIRENECLCTNCGNFKPNQPDNCPLAQAFYQICVKGGNAFAMARCEIWKPKEANEVV